MFPQVEYSFYTDKYKGTKITKDEWDEYYRHACEFINELTGSQLITANLDDKQLELVSYAICALADYDNDDKARIDKEGIASESVGGHSRSYNTSALHKTLQEVYEEKKKVVMGYLLPTNLLYKGVLCSHIR